MSHDIAYDNKVTSLSQPLRKKKIIKNRKKERKPESIRQIVGREVMIDNVS